MTIRRQLKDCLRTGCLEQHRNKGAYCELHTFAVAGWSARPSVKDGRYKSAAWKVVRAQVLKEERVCRMCKWNESTEVDHIISPGEGGEFFTRSNLQGACRSCNSAKAQEASVKARMSGV